MVKGVKSPPLKFGRYSLRAGQDRLIPRAVAGKILNVSIAWFSQNLATLPPAKSGGQGVPSYYSLRMVLERALALPPSAQHQRAGRAPKMKVTRLRKPRPCKYPPCGVMHYNKNFHSNSCRALEMHRQKRLKAVHNERSA